MHQFFPRPPNLISRLTAIKGFTFHVKAICLLFLFLLSVADSAHKTWKSAPPRVLNRLISCTTKGECGAKFDGGLYFLSTGMADWKRSCKRDVNKAPNSK